MNLTNRSTTAIAATAAAKSQSMTTFLSGLAAWLGGVAFCFGSGLTGPRWVAAIVTVLSIAAVTLSRVCARRTR
jgi:hypothetical protein